MTLIKNYINITYLCTQFIHLQKYAHTQTHTHTSPHIPQETQTNLLITCDVVFETNNTAMINIRDLKTKLQMLYCDVCSN